MAVLAYVFPPMLPYLPTLRQLPSHMILSTSCHPQTVIFTWIPKGHTGTAPFSQSQASLPFSPRGTHHLSGGNVMLFSPTRTNTDVHSCCRLPPSLAALGSTRSHRHQPEPFMLSASTFPSGAWLNAVPSSSTGTIHVVGFHLP